MAPGEDTTPTIVVGTGTSATTVANSMIDRIQVLLVHLDEFDTRASVKDIPIRAYKIDPIDYEIEEERILTRESWKAKYKSFKTKPVYRQVMKITKRPSNHDRRVNKRKKYLKSLRDSA